MLNKLKLRDLISTKKYQNPYSKIKGGMILTVLFKRNVMETTNYRFAGICIAAKKKGIASNVIIRNVISLYPLEYTFNIYSPLVTVISKKAETNKRIRKSKLYYLRVKPAPMSKYNFKYVL